MKQSETIVKNPSNRRSFLKKGMLAAGAATVGGALLTHGLSAVAQERDEERGNNNSDLTRGDIAILKFLAAAELIESDLWQQYAELGGTQDKELPGLRGGSALYTAALQVLDQDMPQYIHDNTEDEISHAGFLNAYLSSKGQNTVSLDGFRNLPSSKATGAQQIGRLTNLMQLTVDTSWWTRYRSRTKNPDLDPGFRFAQAVPSLSVGQHTAIPRTDDDVIPDANKPNNISDHTQAIANTAGFHFAFIEQGGSSLYPSLAERVSNAEVLRILLSIGPTETSHFQTWHDKAGNAPALTDPNDPSLVFPDLSGGGEDLQKNLIMPEPTVFLNRKFPAVSIIRPVSIKENGAVAAIRGFRDDGLFIGQSREFLEIVFDLARKADAARREL